MTPKKSSTHLVAPIAALSIVLLMIVPLPSIILDLLLSIEEVLNKSGRFRTVLTPRNDPKSHYDHFHIEAAIDYSAAELP